MAPRLLMLLACIIFLSISVKSDDEEERLLAGINNYRVSLNLPALTENKNAECLADQIVEQFKKQDCTNTTGANTVPGTENQFPNFPQFLDHCHLNISTVKGGAIMPACVPGLEPALVLSNFTQSQYTQYLNASEYTGAGIASEDNWIVVVLSTDTPLGSFAKSSGSVNTVAKSFYLLIATLALLMAFVH